MSVESTNGVGSGTASVTPRPVGTGTEIFALLSGNAGPRDQTIEKIVSRLDALEATNPGAAATLRDEVLGRLTPVDKGNFLRATDQGHAEMMRESGAFPIMPLQAKTTTPPAAAPTTKKPTIPPTTKKQPPTTPPTVDATAKTFDKPKSPGQAPSVIKLPDSVQKQADAAWLAAAQPNGARGINTVLADKKTGALSIVPLDSKYDSDKFKIVGEIIPYANSAGAVYTPEVGGDAAVMVQGKDNFFIGQNGEMQAMMVRTDKTPKSLDAVAIKNEFANNYNERVTAGFSANDAVRYANMEMAEKYGFAYYEGKNGTLNRVDTSQAGKADFQKTPPAPDPKKIATATDFVSVKTVDSAPKQLKIDPALQAKIDADAKQTFKDGVPKEQGGVIAFDRRTGALIGQDMKNERSSGTMLISDHVVDNPQTQALGGIYHTHPMQVMGDTVSAAVFSAGDIAGFSSSGESVSIVQVVSADGKNKTQYMMVRTAQTSVITDAKALQDRISVIATKFYEEGKGKLDVQQAYEMAVQVVTKENNIAFYKGEAGVFKKIN
jgi:hypothetical protein